jgi:hypothetical protein
MFYIICFPKPLVFMTPVSATESVKERGGGGAFPFYTDAHTFCGDPLEATAPSCAFNNIVHFLIADKFI